MDGSKRCRRFETTKIPKCCTWCRVYELLLAAGWLPAAPNAPGPPAAAPAHGTMAAATGVGPVQNDSVASIADQPLQQ